MSRKSKFSYEVKLAAVQQYLNSGLSYAQIAKSIGVSGRSVNQWMDSFKLKGPDALKVHKHNQSYTKEFKLKCIKAYLNGQGSYEQLANKYGLRGSTQLKNWVSKYNSHRRLENYYPTPEVYKMTRKKTNQQEREEIVKYCRYHDLNYKETAKKYGCSYAQVYNWCKKYEHKGNEGLKDNRGRKRSQSELSELEKMQLQVKELQRQLEISQRENMLLKKVRDLEREWLLDQNKGK
ncbi:hypothetical protein IMAU30115_00150 [Lactobacillus helveticus]|uniref:helix-turn-helix domain-containing protein n=1 Tax=Lactobacillus helveticus TaxID=1587 RepID=UPI001561B571|nr:helix-turn-helix domain-containing protein [Lactobacillus helveticus]NRN79994.1 hypothetical protein [Lactobacillus helveticus]NRO23527.1 hypothetical protein [Lactobacillus helveticus]